MIDPDNTGFMKFANLIIVMEDKLRETDTMEDLLAQLKKLDTDNDDKIPAPYFKQCMLNMGICMPSEEVDEMMKEADGKGDGFVDIIEFADRLCPPKGDAKK